VIEHILPINVHLLVYETVSSQQYLFGIRLLQYVQSLTPDDGRKDRPKHVVLLQQNKFGFITEIEVGRKLFSKRE